MSFGRSTKTALLALALFAFLSLLLFRPIFFGKVNLNGNLLVSFYAPFSENLPFKNSGWDQLRIYFPFYKVTLDSIKNFDLPLWNPYAFSGHPHLADFQTAVFYPLNIFGLILGQIEFWHLLRITPMILAAFFTFLYLSSGLALSRLASIFGAVTFGFSPFILTWGEEVVMSPHSIVWLPLILWAIERFWSSQNKRAYFLDKLENDRNGGGRKYLAIIALATAFSFFGGYMQTSIYMFIFVFVYLIFRMGPKNVFVSKQGLKILTSFLFGALIAAIQLIPSGELFFDSGRADITLREKLFEFLLPIESILTYLAPDFFGHPATYNFFRASSAQYYEGIMFVGVAALIFAIWAILVKGKDKPVNFLAIFGLVALSTTIDLPTSRLFLSLPIPFLSTSIANRILFIPAFCLAVLASLGMQFWLEQRDKKILRVIFTLWLLYALIVFYLFGVRFFNLPYFEQAKFLAPANATVSLRNLVIPLAVFAVSVFLIWWGSVSSRWKREAAVLVIVVAFLHIFYFSQKYFSFSDRQYIFPTSDVLNFIQEKETSSPDGEEQGLYRSWGVGEAFLENNFASQYSLYWPEGYDSLNNRSYGEFTYTMQGANIDDFVFRADAGLGRGNTAELVENPARRRLVDLVGVKYVIANDSDDEVLAKNNFNKVFSPPSPEASADDKSLADRSEGKFSVWENLTVMPRVFLASNYEGPPSIAGNSELSDEQISRERRKLIPQKLLSDDFDFRNVLILEKPSPISAQFGEGSAEITSYKNHEVVVKTRSDQPKLLFLSDNWYPGWKATVDGDETEILRANYTFRAVPLIAGEHEVRFYYDSEIFKLGLTISAISLLALAWFTLARSRLLG